ncbi:MAG: glycine--tRNA ligase [Bacillota bacterium]|nr:glycine--tRNA ligase [Bacillota bacterium]
MSSQLTMDRLVALARNRGFVYPGSDIYGGLANAWDYGPLGVELKNRIKQLWWQAFVQRSRLNVGVDCAILMNRRVWEASGHVSSFSDPLIDCRECRSRYRADQLIGDWNAENGVVQAVDGWPNEELEAYIAEHEIACPKCGARNFTPIRHFNMMFRTYQGVTEDSAAEIYLRPETAQGIFVNFRNVQRSTRRKLPFGIAQIGKSFRNEITPGNFIFRTREFEQMELEFFCQPGTNPAWFDYWREFCYNFLIALGLPAQDVRFRDHTPEELSFYSRATTDLEYLFPFGWGEVWGIADRTDYDLGRHIEHSRQDLSYFDPTTNEKYIPYVVEPSLGADRTFLAVLAAAYDEETLADGETRTVLRFRPALAPVQIAVLPLSAKLSEEAAAVADLLSRDYSVEFDDRQAIGRRYRRQDEIGTPWCVTYDFDSREDQCVTVRDRDTMQQERIPIQDLRAWFTGRFDFDMPVPALPDAAGAVEDGE